MPAKAGLRADLAIDLAGGPHLGQEAPRDAEEAQQFVVPAPRVDIEEHRPRGVGRIGDMQPSAGELPDEPGVDRPEGKLAFLGARSCPGDIVEHPGDLGAGEVGIGQQARSAPGSWPRGRPARSWSQAGAVRRSCQTMAWRIGLAAVPVPEDRRLSLVRDSDGGHVARAEPGEGERLRGHAIWAVQISRGSCSTQPACG